MTKIEAKELFQTRLKEQTHNGQTHDSYIQTAIEIMADVMSEAIEQMTEGKK